MRIRAEAHSDDHRVEVDFDATPYFVAATDDELRELAATGWAHDYPADAVAQHVADHDPAVQRLFTYLEFIPTMPYSSDTVGFECDVDEHDARAWLRLHRPALHDELWADELDDDARDGPPGAGPDERGASARVP